MRVLDKIVLKLEPPVLRERFKMLRNGWNKEQLSNLKLLKDEAGRLSVEFVLTEAGRSRLNIRGSKPSSSKNQHSTDRINAPDHIRKEDKKKDEDTNSKRRNGKLVNGLPTA